MSYDFAFWKRSKLTKTAMLRETYESICNGNDHISMAFFDAQKVLNDLKDSFGYLDDFESADSVPFTMDIGQGENGNWIILNCIYSKAKQVEEKCIEIAVKNDIMLYNPQQTSVWNNKRPK
ncbi:MAG: hypothetical protein LBQ91_01370 [Oscillospiraceae bacterium]|jgi:hypothetical protein|nr:hypothetical protein [Oscillospiraceae bacterium]